MDKDLIYIRAVQINIPNKFFRECNIGAVRKWSNMVAEIISGMRRELGIEVAMHIGSGYVYVLCRNDIDNLKAFDFLYDRFSDVSLCKRFPGISKAYYEKVWGPYRG